jgi:hypothetical protein
LVHQVLPGPGAAVVVQVAVELLEIQMELVALVVQDALTQLLEQVFVMPQVAVAAMKVR